MQVTFHSCFMSLIWGSILMAILYLCRKRCIFIHRIGATGTVLLYLFCAVRMILPLEFPFTRDLIMEGGLSDICLVIEKGTIEKGTITQNDMSVLSVFLYVWLHVAAVVLLCYVYRYYITMRKVSTYAIQRDEQCKRVLERVIHKSGRRMKINLRYSREVSIPMGIGVLDKSIILPDEEYSDKELYHILSHEYMHFLNRDLQIKMLIHIFCCIFWWNPAVYLMKEDVNQILEIRCDLCVTGGMDSKEKAEYLTTILSIIKTADAAKRKMAYGAAELITGNYGAGIREQQSAEPKQDLDGCVGLCTFGVIYFFIYVRHTANE